MLLFNTHWIFGLCCFIVSMNALQQGMQSSAGIISVSMETQSSCRRSRPTQGVGGVSWCPGGVAQSSLMWVWNETMAGREWDALLALCTLYHNFSLFHFFVSCCLAVRFPLTFSLSLSLSATQTQSWANTHMHSPGMNWTVCKTAQRIMKTKTGCQREYIYPGGMIFSPKSCNLTHCRGGVSETGWFTVCWELDVYK